MDFEVVGVAWVEVDGRTRVCHEVVAFTPTGAEVWLYVDRGTGELLHAERIDGQWAEVDLERAAEEFADVLRCV